MSILRAGSIILIMTILGSVASYFLKKASSQAGFIFMLKNYNIYLGGLLYLFAALLNVYLLKFMDYSILLPLTSITYIWTIFIAYWFLDEKVTRGKIFGILLIILGVYILLL